MDKLLMLLSFLLFGQFVAAQDLGFEFRGKYKYAISQNVLWSAAALTDINPGFPDSWIKDHKL